MLSLWRRESVPDFATAVGEALLEVVASDR
jgi:hypothetical protein